MYKGKIRLLYRWCRRTPWDGQGPQRGGHDLRGGGRVVDRDAPVLPGPGRPPRRPPGLKAQGSGHRAQGAGAQGALEHPPRVIIVLAEP